MKHESITIISPTIKMAKNLKHWPILAIRLHLAYTLIYKTLGRWWFLYPQISWIDPVEQQSNWSIARSRLKVNGIIIMGFSIENCHRNSGFTHWKWWFSIAMLNYHRVIGYERIWIGFFLGFLKVYGHPSQHRNPYGCRSSNNRWMTWMTIPQYGCIIHASAMAHIYMKYLNINARYVF